MDSLQLQLQPHPPSQLYTTTPYTVRFELFPRAYKYVISDVTQTDLYSRFAPRTILTILINTEPAPMPFRIYYDSGPVSTVCHTRSEFKAELAKCFRPLYFNDIWDQIMIPDNVDADYSDPNLLTEYMAYSVKE